YIKKNSHLNHKNFKSKLNKLNVRKLVEISIKAKEIRELTTAEIEQKEQTMKEELFNLRFQLATGQLENTARISKVKKTIARLKTVVRQREIENETAVNN